MKIQICIIDSNKLIIQNLKDNHMDGCGPWYKFVESYNYVGFIDTEKVHSTQNVHKYTWIDGLWCAS